MGIARYQGLAVGLLFENQVWAGIQRYKSGGVMW